MARLTKERRSAHDAGDGLTRRTFVRLGVAGAVAVHLHPLVLEPARASGARRPAAGSRVGIRLAVNGRTRRVAIDPRTTLVDLLRDDLGLTGTGKACDRGWCGACTVLVDGAPSAACSRLAVDLVGRDIRTREGLAHPDRLGPRPDVVEGAGTPASSRRRGRYGRWIRAEAAGGRVLAVDLDGARAAEGVVDARLVLAPGERVPWAGAPLALVLGRTPAAVHDAARRARVTLETARPRVTLPRIRPREAAHPWRVVGARGDAEGALEQAPVKVRVATRLAPVPRPGSGPGPELPAAPGAARRQPVTLLLDAREARAARAARPAQETRVTVGADRDGRLLAWLSETWSVGDDPGVIPPPLPCLLDLEHRRQRHLVLPGDLPPPATWPEADAARACLLTLGALDAVAARLGLDPLEVLLRNLEGAGDRTDRTGRALRHVAARVAWPERSGAMPASGPRRDGVGLGLHVHHGLVGAVAAEVELDIGTGSVRVRRLAAAHDVPPAVDPGDARAALRRGLLAGASLALCDERILDPVTGRVLEDRPGLLEHPAAAAEPAVEVDLLPVEESAAEPLPGPDALAGAAMISPAAAIAGAVARAAGVQVTALPLTPARVVAALEAGGIAP